MRPGLEALRDRGVRLAILSNGEPRMLEAAARSAGIDTLLDTIISVEEVKIFKVSPRVYNLGPERLGVGRSALGFVSSNAWGHRRGRFGRPVHLLDSAQRRRAARGARVRRGPRGLGDYRPAGSAGTCRLRQLAGDGRCEDVGAIPGRRERRSRRGMLNGWIPERKDSSR